MTLAWEARADLVVVGTGVAGLTAALEAVATGLRVLIVTKGSVDESNTRWAQGGVAVVLPDQHDPHDSIPHHVNDTLTAGAGLCDELAARSIIAGGPSAVAALRRRGAIFDSAVQGRLARTKEGGHSAYRVIHAGGDATGAEIERALSSAAADVPILENHTAVDVLRDEHGAHGLLVIDDNGMIGAVRSPAVLLATGGLGQLYHATTNPDIATADGIALALRAGAEVADVEFVQFHPTVLFTGPQAIGHRPLITEAVRGEGAVLVDATGARIMAGVHPLEDLAPRDVVSAAIARRLAEAPGADHVFLDATHLSSAKFRERFPTVHAACAAAGIDPGTEPIPVAPAAHFGCGGVVTDVYGRTSVPGLYAVGEVARTGLHGANRLASNSLLEGLVVGTRIGRSVHRIRESRAVPAGELPKLPIAHRQTLQRSMSRYAGIGRDLAGLNQVVTSSSVRTVSSRADAENAALDLTARALVVAAVERTESRGCHVRNDHPASDDRWRYSLLVGLDDAGTPTIAGTLALRGVA